MLYSSKASMWKTGGSAKGASHCAWSHHTLILGCPGPPAATGLRPLPPGIPSRQLLGAAHLSSVVCTAWHKFNTVSSLNFFLHNIEDTKRDTCIPCHLYHAGHVTFTKGESCTEDSDTTPECRRYPAKLSQHSTYGPHWQALLRSLKGADPMGMCQRRSFA